MNKMNQTNAVGMNKNNAIALSIPLAGAPFMQLLTYTINSADISEEKKKELIDLAGRSIKVPPGASHISINKGSKTLEIYLDLDDINFDNTTNMRDAVTEMNFNGKEYGQTLEQAGQILFMANVYFDSLRARIPAVFETIKTSLNIPAENVLDGIFIDDQTRKMYIDYRVNKRLMVKFKCIDTDIAEKNKKKLIDN